MRRSAGPILTRILTDGKLEMEIVPIWGLKGIYVETEQWKFPRSSMPPV
jgi:hypothetical protein